MRRERWPEVLIPSMLAIHYNALTGKKHQAIVLHINNDTGAVCAAFFNSNIKWAVGLSTMSAPPSVMSAVGFNATHQTYMVGQTDHYDTFQPVPRAGRVSISDLTLLIESLF